VEGSTGDWFAHQEKRATNSKIQGIEIIFFSVKQRTFPSIVPDGRGNFKKRYPTTEVLGYFHCVPAGRLE
jgi:hypothetical protein